MATMLRDKAALAAFDLIEKSALPHPSGQVLMAFIEDALYPRLAAEHILQKCNAAKNQHAELLQIAARWTDIVKSSMSKHARLLKHWLNFAY